MDVLILVALTISFATCGIRMAETAAVGGIPLSGEHFRLLDPRRPRMRRITDEERLSIRLFRKYDVKVGPTYNGTAPAFIEFKIKMATILKLEEIKQVFHAYVWVDLHWEDERLAWDPGRFNGMKKMAVRTKRIWLPDIVLYNSAEKIDTRFMHDVFASVDYTGKVHLAPYINVRSFCPIEVTLFPFDETTCLLKFGSWAYDRLILKNMSSTADMTRYSESGKWQILSTEIRPFTRKRLIFNLRQNHSAEYMYFSDLEVVIKMRRRFLFNYLFEIFVPSSIISILTLHCFWLDPRDGEKISLGIVGILFYTILRLTITKSIPMNSDTYPLITRYVVMTMSMTGAVVATQVCLLILYKHGNVNKPVPKWVEVIVERGLAKLLGMRYKDVKTKIRKNIAGGSDDDEDYEIKHEKKLRTYTDRLKTIRQYVKAIKRLEREIGRFKNDELQNRMPDRPVQPPDSSTKRRLCLLQRVSDTVSYIMIRSQTEQLQKARREEWMTIAFVVDRFLFYVCTLFLVTYTIVTLLLKPFIAHLPHEHGTFASY